VSPVKYEMGFYVPETGFFIITAVKNSDLTEVPQFLKYACDVTRSSRPVIRAGHETLFISAGHETL
jgi:hypothetical protein